MQVVIEVWEGRVLAAARVLAGLTVADLAKVANVSKTTVNDLELKPLIEVTPLRRHGYTSKEVWAKIVAALADHGVELLPDRDGHGAGCRFRGARTGASE